MPKLRSAAGGAPALSRGRRTTIAVLAACVPLLAGCGAGFDAQTNQVYQPAVGVNDRSSEVFVINALLVSDGSGTGTVVASLINQTTEPDRLLAVVASSTTGAPLEATDLGAGVELPPQEPVQLSGEGISVTATTEAGDTGSGEAGGVTVGSFVTLQFQFELASLVEVEAPVVSNEDPVYADITVSPPASPQ